MSREIDELKKTAGDYKTWALKARSKYIDLRLNNETEIRALYVRLVQDISNELKKEGISQIRKMQLLALIEILKKQQNKLESKLTTIFEKYIKANAGAATEYAKAIDIKAVQEAGVSKVSTSKVKELYFSSNQRAIETCWSRTHNGLYLSDRIWTKSKRYRENITEIIQSAVAEGQDCVKTARMLEKYVKTGKKTLAKQYPNMMKRMGSRVPEDICYESLRLARTEMTAAYGEATIQSAVVSPSCSGVKFILSGSHPKYDICDDICGVDDYGLGIGCYPVDKAPTYPFHPNCLCVTLTINENPSDFVDRLKRWNKNPGSEPGLEQWYQNIYKKSSMYIDDISKIPYNGIKETELLPNVDKVVIPEAKIKSYALNKSHPSGKDKAIAFEKALGYNINNADDLIKNVKDNVSKYKAVPKGESQFGKKYEVVMNIKGPNGKVAKVLTGWIITPDSDTPRLTTIHVDK
jgi:hypothetical protein